MGYKVTTIDLDLGGANLHTCLGVPVPDKTLSDFLSKKVSNLEDLVTQTPIPNLQIISGAQDELGVANIKQMHKNKILSKLDSLKSDFVLFDLGAGTTFNTLDFFIHSSTGILVVLPEPTSIENTYRFIKSIFHRKLKLIEESLDVEPIINRVLNAKMGSNKLTPYDLLLELEVTHPEVGKKLISEIQNFRPKLIMNQVRTQADIDIGFSMKSICKKYFGIDLQYAGYLDYDPTVWQSVKKRKPLLVEFPHSKLASNFDKIVHRLLN